MTVQLKLKYLTTLRRNRKPAGNSTFAKGGVSCAKDTFVVAESSVLRMKLSAKNPALRVAAKRNHQIIKDSKTKNIWQH